MSGDRYTMNMYARNGEPFTAVSDCPKCGETGVHWLRETPSKRDQLVVNLMATTMKLNAPYPADSVATVRECVACGHLWVQA